MPNQNTESITLLISTTAVILLLAGFIITILYLYQKKQFAFQRNMEEIKQNHERNILQTQLEIQEQTFMEVSREIHDNIALGLTLSKLHLNTLNYPDPVPFQDKIDLSIGLIGDAIQNLSNISKSLSADIIKRYGLLKALENEIENLNKTGLFHVIHEVTGVPAFLDSGVELVIFRIIQESLNNIVKHSGARNISIIQNYSLTNLTVQVSDDGNGFSIDELHEQKGYRTGSGLNNMAQRAKAINSGYSIISTAGSGTTVQLLVPLSINEENNCHG